MVFVSVVICVRKLVVILLWKWCGLGELRISRLNVGVLLLVSGVCSVSSVIDVVELLLVGVVLVFFVVFVVGVVSVGVSYWVVLKFVFVL